MLSCEVIKTKPHDANPCVMARVHVAFFLAQSTKNTIDRSVRVFSQMNLPIQFFNRIIILTHARTRKLLGASILRVGVGLTRLHTPPKFHPFGWIGPLDRLHTHRNGLYTVKFAEPGWR